MDGAGAIMRPHLRIGRAGTFALLVFGAAATIAGVVAWRGAWSVASVPLIQSVAV